VRELFSCLVLMLQKEVGERLVAVPGTSAYGSESPPAAPLRIDRVCTVRPGSFFRAPKWTPWCSASSRCRRLGRSRQPGAVRQVVKGPSPARKTCQRLRERTSRLIRLLDRSLAEADRDPRRRGETLSLEEFARLSRTWEGFLGDSSDPPQNG